MLAVVGVLLTPQAVLAVLVVVVLVVLVEALQALLVLLTLAVARVVLMEAQELPRLAVQASSLFVMQTHLQPQRLQQAHQQLR
jgi:hypothetical protein